MQVYPDTLACKYKRVTFLPFQHNQTIIYHWNIEKLNIGESIHAGAVELPVNIDLGMAEETVVASVNYEMKEEELETAISEEEDVTFDEESDEPQDSEESSEDAEQSKSDSE